MTVSVFSALTASSADLSPQEPPQQGDTAALQLMLELASDFASADPAVRAEALNLIDKEANLLGKEGAFAEEMFAADSDSHYRSLVSAKGIQSFDYLRALRASYARFKGAQAAGDREWSAKQLKATQEYAALAANAVGAEAQLNEGGAARFRESPFAVRRSAAQQAAFVDKIKTGGLTPEHRKLLLDSRLTDAEIEEFRKQLLQESPDRIGRSLVEWLSKIAASRRQIARQLSIFAQANAAAVAGASAQTFVVGNPHDKQENVDLFILPISIPVDWKLSIANAEQVETSGKSANPGDDPSEFPVREVETGKHYVVTLPAKGEVRVASLLIPVGEMGVNTTARWAVEGKIGDELIGGMVHEMNVPYIIPDLKLPPVGSLETEELPSTSGHLSRLILMAVVASAAVILLLLFLILRRRQRARVAP